MGDDDQSWAYDGLRERRWHKGWAEYGRKWKDGDVVSCTLDLDSTPVSMAFYLNGVSLGVAYQDFEMPNEFRAAASFDKKLVGEGCEFSQIPAPHRFLTWVALRFASRWRALRRWTISKLCIAPSSNRFGASTIWWKRSRRHVRSVHRCVC